MMRRVLMWGVLLAVGGSAAAQNSPRIVGQVQPANGLTAVAAVDRQSKKRLTGKIVDAAKGRFAVAGLTLDRTYDLQLDFGLQRRLEGINLTVPRSDYVEEQPLAAEDLKVIRKKVLRLNKFEDEVEIMTIQGLSLIHI